MDCSSSPVTALPLWATASLPAAISGLAAYALKTGYPALNMPAFVNAGISGQKAEDMAPRFAKDMKLADKPAVTFINVGINDVWHRLAQPHDPAVLEAYKADVTKMVDMAQAAGAKVVLLTPTVIQENARAERGISG